MCKTAQCGTYPSSITPIVPGYGTAELLGSRKAEGPSDVQGWTIFMSLDGTGGDYEQPSGNTLWGDGDVVGTAPLFKIFNGLSGDRDR
jgi:hypothetical protein